MNVTINNNDHLCAAYAKPVRMSTALHIWNFQRVTARGGLFDLKSKRRDLSSARKARFVCIFEQ